MELYTGKEILYIFYINGCARCTTPRMSNGGENNLSRLPDLTAKRNCFFFIIFGWRGARFTATNIIIRANCVQWNINSGPNMIGVYPFSVGFFFSLPSPGNKTQVSVPLPYELYMQRSSTVRMRIFEFFFPPQTSGSHVTQITWGVT